MIDDYISRFRISALCAVIVSALFLASCSANSTRLGGSESLSPASDLALSDGELGKDASAAPKKWYFFTLDTSVRMEVSIGGNRVSQAIVNGNPAVAYREYNSGDLRFCRATNANGTSWGAPVVVASTGSPGLFCGLGVVNGNPAIAYWDSANGDLCYVRANDANGTSWGTPLTVDAEGNSGLSVRSMIIVNGNPAVCYGSDTGTAREVRYIRATDANGTAWGSPVVLDSNTASSDTPLGGTLAIVNGYPAACYRNWDDNYCLRFIRATDANGDSWSSPITLDTEGSVGHWSWLAVVNGNPAISYEHEIPNSISDLRYIRATNANGTAWGSPQTLDSVGNTGWMTSLAVVGGYPAISYYNGGVGDLYYIKAKDASGSSWGKGGKVESVGTTGRFGVLLSVNDNPGISYYDLSNHRIRYAKFQ